MKKFYFLLLLIPFFSFAQGVSSDYENMARARAEAQGVNPDVLEQRLKDKGIDMKSLTLDDIPRIQPVVEQEIAAMKAIQEGVLPTKTYVSPPEVDSTRLNTRIEIKEIEAFDTKALVQENDGQESVSSVNISLKTVPSTPLRSVKITCLQMRIY